MITAETLVKMLKDAREAMAEQGGALGSDAIRAVRNAAYALANEADLQQRRRHPDPDPPGIDPDRKN